MLPLKNKRDLCCLEGGAKRVGVLVGGASALAGPLLAYPEVAQVDRVIGGRSGVRRLRRPQALLHLVHHLHSRRLYQ